MVEPGDFDVAWNDIAGLQGAKDLLQEAASLPLLLPDFFVGLRRPWRGEVGSHRLSPGGTGSIWVGCEMTSPLRAQRLASSSVVGLSSH